MAIKELTYCSNSVLTCRKCLPADVILCIDPDLVAPIACPESEVEAIQYSFIEGTLVQAYQVSSACRSTTWKYVIEYEDFQIVDSGSIVAADVVGIFCKTCFAKWAEEKIGNEVYLRENEDGSLTLVTQHGCEYTFFPGVS